MRFLRHKKNGNGDEGKQTPTSSVSSNSNNNHKQPVKPTIDEIIRKLELNKDTKVVIIEDDHGIRRYNVFTGLGSTDEETVHNDQVSVQPMINQLLDVGCSVAHYTSIEEFIRGNIRKTGEKVTGWEKEIMMNNSGDPFLRFAPTDDILTVESFIPKLLEIQGFHERLVHMPDRSVELPYQTKVNGEVKQGVVKGTPDFIITGIEIPLTVAHYDKDDEDYFRDTVFRKMVRGYFNSNLTHGHELISPNVNSQVGEITDSIVEHYFPGKKVTAARTSKERDILYKSRPLDILSLYLHMTGLLRVHYYGEIEIDGKKHRVAMSNHLLCDSDEMIKCIDEELHIQMGTPFDSRTDGTHDDIVNAISNPKKFLEGECESNYKTVLGKYILDDLERRGISLD